MIELINAADHNDRHNKGIKQWAKNCELHQKQEIEELVMKRIKDMYK